MSQLGPLFLVFAYLSLLTVGGGMAAYPEMEQLTVNVHHWLTVGQLTHLYSVGQMAPGPNMNMVASVGERVAGVLGAVVVLIAFYAPTGLLTLNIGRLWTKLENWPWRTSIQEGLAPTALGLMLAGAITFGKSALRFAKSPTTPIEISWIGIAITVVVFVILLRSKKVNPALLVLAGGLIGLVVDHP